MNDSEYKERPPRQSEGNPDPYPSAIESLSSKWRQVQSGDQGQQKPGTGTKRNTTALGIGIGLAIVLFLIAVGGFLLLVWTVNR